MGILSVFASKAKDIGTGVKDAFTGAGDAVTGIIDSAKGQIPPDYQGQIELMRVQVKSEIQKLQMNVEVQLAELTLEAQKEVHSFALSYEGTAEQVPKWILILRSVIRPVITILTMVSMFLFIGIDITGILSGEEMEILTMLPNAYWWIVGVVVGFWFGGKAGENIVDKMKSK